MGLYQRGRLDGVAPHRRLAGLAQLLDQIAVLVGDDEGDALPLQRRGNALPDAAVGDDDHLVAQEARIVLVGSSASGSSLRSGLRASADRSRIQRIAG